MSIIDNKEVVVDVSVKLARIEQRIRQMTQGLYGSIERQYQDIFNFVWNNPRGVPAQQIFDEFGVEARDLLVFSGQVQGLLKAVNPNYVFPTRPNEIKIHADGTVTVGNAI